MAKGTRAIDTIMLNFLNKETYPIEEAKYKLLQLLQFQFVTETNILAAIFTANIVTCSPKPPPVSVVSVFETPVASTSKMEKPKPVLILREEDKSDSDLEDNLQDKEEQRQNMAATNVKHEQQVTVPVPHNSQTQIRSRPKKDGSVSSKPQVEKITALNSLSHTKHGELGPNEGVRLVEQQETAPNKPEVSRLPKLGDNNPIIPQSHKKDAMQELPLPQQQNPEIYRINIEYLDLDIKPRKRDTIVEQPSPRGFNAKKFKKSAVGRMISSAKREMNSPPKNTSSSGSSSKGAEITDDILEMFIFQHATVAPPSGNTSVEDEYSQVDDDVKLFNFDVCQWFLFLLPHSHPSSFFSPSLLIFLFIHTSIRIHLSLFIHFSSHLFLFPPFPSLLIILPLKTRTIFFSLCSFTLHLQKAKEEEGKKPPKRAKRK